MQTLIWIVTIINVVGFVPALYWASLTIATFGNGEISFKVAATLILSTMLPLLCVLVPGLAWRNYNRSRPSIAIAIILMPTGFAAVLYSLVAL